jgi:hypothetical protein
MSKVIMKIDLIVAKIVPEMSDLTSTRGIVYEIKSLMSLSNKRDRVWNKEFGEFVFCMLYISLSRESSDQ